MPTKLLTDVFLRTAPDGEWHDERVKGLTLRVSSRAKTWSFRYRPHGSIDRKRLPLGRYPEVGVALARERAESARVAVSGGGDPQGERKERKAAASRALDFNSLADEYLARYARAHKRSWKQDELLLAAHVRPAWGTRMAGKITRADAAALLDDLAARAPTSANRTHSILSKAFNWAVETGLVEANPVAQLKKRGKETPKDRTLSPAEIRCLWGALDDSGVHPSVAGALRVLLLTGQRPGEIAGAEVSELKDGDNGARARLEIPAARMKAGRQHVVPLAPMALSIVKACAGRAEGLSHIFHSNFAARGAVARHSLSQAVRRIVQGLDEKADEAAVTLKANPPTPHDFRRTVATGLAALGVLREDRMALLAHSSGDVHAIHYDQYERLKEKRAALEMWESHIVEIVAPEPAGNVIKLGRRQ
jgi:integrase